MSNLIKFVGRHSPSNEFPSKAPELELHLFSNKVMNLNFTSTLLSLYETVSSNWSEEYEQNVDKRRSPFVPFALKNETGSPLKFYTVLSNTYEAVSRSQQRNVRVRDPTQGISVEPSELQAFSFEGRGKLRHRNTHQLKTHQLVVRVEGWQETTPVSVDKVGTYFRNIKPDLSQRRVGSKVFFSFTISHSSFYLQY